MFFNLECKGNVFILNMKFFFASFQNTIKTKIYLWL
jgi:hypothetical protein